MPVRLVSQEELPSPLNGYKLIERLGRGGFGEVWKVEAPGGLLKAAKFVFGDLDSIDDEERAAKQELKALDRVKFIRHPYILSIEQVRIIDGELIIVMELADRNLWDRFRECRAQGMVGVPRDELLRYMEETAEALDLMNTHHQIQHLDVKPQNLFLVHSHVKVGDFGLAKLLEGMRATVTGGVTPVYAAPETFEGWVSRFSDQYSLAIVFQELLTGTRPFNGSNTRQLLMQHINGTPELGSLPLADRSIIGRGLSKKPDDRWPTCTDLVRALKLSGLPQPPQTPQTLQKTPRRGSPPYPNPGSGAIPRPGRPVAEGSDSAVVTRMAMGGSGRLGTDPTANTKSETPQPGGLPPLMKPGGGNPPMNTPMPGHSGRLVTPGAAAAANGISTVNNPSHTLQRPVIFQTGRMGSLGIAPPEMNGDGPLFPALVVAVGQTGRRVAEAVKRLICERFGHPDKVPNVQFLYIDTDSDTITANPGEDPGAIAPRETVIARLNRPSHYLQRDSLPPVEGWMPTGALYKLARVPSSANGVRAFGRLALCDHYRLIAQRIRQEIETFLTGGALAEAGKNTKLGLRTNRPRAYILAGLAGGTGGGMFIDLAFLLRHELRQVGYLKPEVVGMFFVPPADKASARSVALGNTYASLAELHHFQSKKTRYQTTFDKSEAPIVDSEPPFARVIVQPLPIAAEAKAQSAVAGRAAHALFNEILTPAGRVADEVRDVYRKAYPPITAACQTFGLYRLSWPRPEMLTAASRRFAQRQIQRWTAKEAAHLREPIAAWLNGQWTERRLELETIIDALHGSVRDALREDPDRVFDAFIDPLRANTPSSGRIAAAGACTVLDQLIKVVGKPDAENDPVPGSLHTTLTAKYEKLAKEAEGHLAMMAATFLEIPQFRLPGAEEAVRQIAGRLKQQVEILEPVQGELSKEVRTTYGRLFQTIGVLNSAGGFGMLAGRKASAASEIMELLRLYPRKRLQLHILDMVLSVYRKLLGNTPEYLRELNFCRSTLSEMHAALSVIAPSTADVTGGGKLILPDGCKNMDAAADQFLAGLAPEDLLAFEQGFQKEIAKKFNGLGSVCLKPLEKGPLFREMLLARSREFLDSKLDHSDPAAIFFRYRTADGSAEPLIGEAFDEAAPDLKPPKGDEQPFEINVLAVPPGPAGDLFRSMAAKVLPSVDLASAPLPGDICFYREYPQLELAKLPHLGGYGLEAFQQMTTTEHSPQSRTDVPWQPPTPT